MKKIRITRECFVAGKPAQVGEELNLSITDAANIIAAGKGEEIKPGKVVNHTAEKVETRDPVSESRDPAPAADGYAPAKPATKRAKPRAEAPAADPAPVVTGEGDPAAPTGAP